MQRQGAGAVYLNVFHSDIEDFLSTKKENADEKIRVKMLSLGVVIPDKYYELLANDEYMHLFSPYDVEREYGTPFSFVDITEEYDNMVANPNIRKRSIKASKLEESIQKLSQESGYPYRLNVDNANRQNVIDGKIIMSNLCVTGDTELLTSNGYVKAKDLYETQEELNVIIDNRTKGMYSFGVDEVSAIPMQLTAKKAEIFELKTKEGFSIKSTEWHKYYVERDGKVEKLQMNQLQLGDKILIQSGEGAYGKNEDTDLAYIMGVIAGDGVMTYNASGTPLAKIYLYESKKTYEEDLTDKVSTIIEKYVGDRTYKHNAQFNPQFSYSQEKDRLSLASAILGDILESKFGFNKSNKLQVPSYVKNGTKEVQAAYLSGLYKMDACVNSNVKYKAMSIELVTISEELAKDIQKMLINMNVFSRIYTREPRKAMLPDGHGSTKEYDCKKTYKVCIQDRHSRDLFMEIVELKDKDVKKAEVFNSALKSTSRNPKHHYLAEVSSIDYFGVEDVYDTTQEDYHSLIFNGIVTGNCSEILQVQKPSKINEDMSYDELGTDISCNLGSINIPNLMDGKDFGKSIDTMVKSLTYVTESTDIKQVPTVQNGNELFHTIGLGAMGLHTYLATKQMHYGEKESVEFVDLFFKTVNYYTLVSSNNIAKQKGSFFEFEKSGYADGSYFEKYLVEDEPLSELMTTLFENIHIPTKSDWEQLKENVQKYGLYHQYRMAVAPNGSISYVNETSASLHPITQLIEKRNEGKTGSTYYPAPKLSNETLPYYKSAYDISMLKLIDIYAAAQKHIDQGMSLTLFMNSEIPAGLYPWKMEGGKMTTKDLTLINYYAWKKGIKTIYYTRTFTEDADEIGVNQCESCAI